MLCYIPSRVKALRVLLEEVLGDIPLRLTFEPELSATCGTSEAQMVHVGSTQVLTCREVRCW
eukprot:1327508-Rhodomonas_salina.1